MAFPTTPHCVPFERSTRLARVLYRATSAHAVSHRLLPGPLPNEDASRGGQGGAWDDYTVCIGTIAQRAARSLLA